MRDKTRHSRATAARLRQARQASQSSAPRRRYICDVFDCDESFLQNTDKSRHLWTHLPEQFCPRCPFIDSSGERCEERYRGRSDHIQSHWAREHRDTPYPSPQDWPKLKRILAENGLRLGEDIAPDISTSAGPYASPVPSSAQSVDFHQAQIGPFGLHHHMPLNPDPYYAGFPQGSNTRHSAHIVHQTITHLPPTSFIGSYPPPFPQHFHGPMGYPPIAYGPPLPYPPAFVPPSQPVHPPSPSPYEQYPEDHFYPRNDNRPHSPIEGSEIRSFDGEGADQGSSTNPFAGNRYHGYPNSSTNYNHYGF